MTRTLLSLLFSASCLVGCAAQREVMPNGRGSSRRLDVAPGGAHPLNAQAAAESVWLNPTWRVVYSGPDSLAELAHAATLVWHMPTRKINGDTLWTAPLDWQVAYSTQSRTYVDHEFWIRNYPDTMTKYWPTVVDEGSPLVVASGAASPGAVVVWPALPVPSTDWPFSFWVRTRQRPNGQWSAWSNPISRADNQ